MIPGILYAVLLGCALQGAYSQSEQAVAKHAHLELLAKQMSQRDSSLLLGVHFTLEKGWHVYWVNPGDSGQPPSLEWQLPPGFTAGEVRWPRPQRLQASPSIADYGYANDVLLMVPVTAPAGWRPGTPLEIAVKAKWLICREECIPDHADLKLSLVPEFSANTAAKQLFAATQKLVPKPWPRIWNATVESRKDDFVLNIVAGKPLRSAEFFPLDPGQIENAAKQIVEPTTRGVKLTLRKSDLLVKPSSQLRGVLVIPGQGAYQLRAPVVTQIALK